MSGFIYDTGFEDPNTTIKRFWIEYKHDEFEDYYKIKIYPLCKFNNQEYSFFYLDRISLNINARMYNENIEDAIRDILRINIKKIDDTEISGDRYSYSIYVGFQFTKTFIITRKVLDNILIFIHHGEPIQEYKFVCAIDMMIYNITAEVYESAWIDSKFGNKTECKFKAVHRDGDIDIYECKINEVEENE